MLTRKVTNGTFKPASVTFSLLKFLVRVAELRLEIGQVSLSMCQNYEKRSFIKSLIIFSEQFNDGVVFGLS